VLESVAGDETFIVAYSRHVYTLKAQKFVEAENVEFFVKASRLQIVYSEHFEISKRIIKLSGVFPVIYSDFLGL
jgi:hypothetical protein